MVEARRRQKFVGSGGVAVSVAKPAEGEKGVVVSRGSIEGRFFA